MVSSKKTKFYTVVFLLMIAVAAVCYAMFRFYYLSSEIGSLLYMIIIGAWSFTIRRRILDKRCRSILTWLCYGMMFWLLLRMCRYNLIGDGTARRYYWYLYYIPMTALPYLMFYVSVLVQRPEEKAVPKWISGLAFLLIPLNLLVLTNDFHQMTFSFSVKPHLWRDDLGYQYGPFYLFVLLWAVVFGVSALMILVRKSRISHILRLSWVPILPVFIGVFLLLLHTTGKIPNVMGRTPFQMQEIICLMCMGFLEGCIRIGMIPSNEGYEKIFAQSSISAQIVDVDGNAIYSSQQKVDLKQEIFHKLLQNQSFVEGDRRFSSVPLQGGYFVWSDDLSSINQLNEDLMEAAEVIADENTLIEEENQLKEDDARFRTMNRLYDEIATIVRPQVLLIEKLLAQDNLSEEEFRRNISLAAFYNAYIKRRSNLVLLAEKEQELDMEELYLSCAESLQYLSLCEKMTYIEPFQDVAVADKSILFDAYDFFEHIIEDNMDQIDAVMVTMRAQKDTVSFRMSFDSHGQIKKLPDTRAKVKHEQDEEMLVLTLVYPRGGALS